MTTITVWKFDDADGAERATAVLKQAEEEGLVKVVDHAVVSWPVGAEQPTSSHAHDGPKRAAGWGAVLGVITGGALFAVPIAGAAVGAAIGAISKAGDGAGITKGDLERIQAEVVEGTSALFLVSDAGQLDRLGERLRGFDKTLVSTNLTEAERETLLETFGGE